MNKCVKVFWTNWLESNECKRLELIKKLIIHNNKAARALKADPEGHTLASVINSYFEDLVEVVKKKEDAG